MAIFDGHAHVGKERERERIKAKFWLETKAMHEKVQVLWFK